jgi:hypothetical protein
MVLTLQSRLALSSSKGGVLRATPPYNPPYKPISFLLLLLGFLSISLSLSSESRLRRQPTISFLLLLGSLSLSLSLFLPALTRKWLGYKRPLLSSFLSNFPQI